VLTLKAICNLAELAYLTYDNNRFHCQRSSRTSSSSGDMSDSTHPYYPPEDSNTTHQPQHYYLLSTLLCVLYTVQYCVLCTYSTVLYTVYVPHSTVGNYRSTAKKTTIFAKGRKLFAETFKIDTYSTYSIFFMSTTCLS